MSNWKRLTDEIEHWRNLQMDLEEGIPRPSPYICDLAIAFLKLRESIGAECPDDAVMDANGGISLEYRPNGIYTSVHSIWEDGEIKFTVFKKS